MPFMKTQLGNTGAARRQLSPLRLKSISDDDVCAACAHCNHRPGESSGCAKGWPGTEDADGYVQVCADLQQ